MTTNRFPRSYIYPVPKCVEDETETPDAALVVQARTMRHAIDRAIAALPPKGGQS